MSLEQKIEALTAALEANTAALLGGGKAAASITTGKKETAAGKKETVEKSKSTRSKAEMQAAVNEVKEAKGTKAAKQIIADVGFEKLAEVTEDKYDALYDAAKKLLEGEDEGSSDDGL